MLTTTLIYAGLLPFAMALIVAIAMHGLSVSSPARWAWGSAAGIVAGQVALKRPLGVGGALRAFAKPHEAVEWLPVIIVVALGSSLLLIEATGRRGRLARLLAALVVVAVPLRLLGGNVRLDEVWNAFDKLVYASLLAGTLGLIWSSLGSRGVGGFAAVRVLLVIVVALGSGVVLTFSGVFVYGRLCGVVAASLMGVAVGCVVTRWSAAAARDSGGVFDGFAGAAGVITVSLGSLILLGHFFADLSPTNATLLLAALALAGSPLPFAAFQPGWRELVVRPVLCLAPLVVAISRVVGW